MADESTEIHVFVQRAPSIVGGQGVLKPYLVRGATREEALETLKASGKLRIEGLQAKQVAYVGQPDSVVGADVLDLREWWEEFANPRTIEFETLPEGHHD